MGQAHKSGNKGGSRAGQVRKEIAALYVMFVSRLQYHVFIPSADPSPDLALRAALAWSAEIRAKTSETDAIKLVVSHL